MDLAGNPILRHSLATTKLLTVDKNWVGKGARSLIGSLGEVDQANRRSRFTGMSRRWRRDEERQFYRTSPIGCVPANLPPLWSMARLPPHPCLAASTA